MTTGSDGRAGDALADDARPTRSSALALARLHLRTGALALARTELETLAGRDGLDDAGVLDLAEVRWRTGDVAGAGEAVTALLDGRSDGDPTADDGMAVAWIIAAEAAAARGRPTEARRHAERLRSLDSTVIDTIFAGALRSSAWPPDPLTLAPGDATLFAPAAEGERGAPAGDVPSPSVPTRSSLAAAETLATGSAGLWDLQPASEPMDELSAEELPEIDPELAAVAEAIAATDAIAESSMDLGSDLDLDLESEVDPDAFLDGPDAEESLDAGLAALAEGDRAAAAVHLGLALRLAPVLAPRVLDLIGDDHDPGMAFVRGDAYRLVGREREARRAFIRARPSTPSPDPRVDDGLGIDVIDDPDPSQGEPA